MEIIEQIDKLINNIDEINDYKLELQKKQGIYDQQISDILHFINSKEKLNPAKDFYLLKELKSIGEQRARTKREIRSIDRFKSVVNKTTEPVKDLYEKSMEKGEGKYNNRVYKDMKTLDIKDKLLYFFE